MCFERSDDDDEDEEEEEEDEEHAGTVRKEGQWEVGMLWAWEQLPQRFLN